MALKEIMEKCSKLNIEEERTITDEYIELVFLTQHIDKWNKLLSDIFGPAVKPAGQKPADSDLVVTEAYGGIYGNQTLFKKDFDGATYIAMFWPWQDNVHTTLKIAQIKDKTKRR